MFAGDVVGYNDRPAKFKMAAIKRKYAYNSACIYMMVTRFQRLYPLIFEVQQCGGTCELCSTSGLVQDGHH